MPEMVEESEVLASGDVVIPTENPCPECGAPLFGHMDEADGPFWLEEYIPGRIHAHETDAGEIVYDLEYECKRCEEEFTETDLGGDDLSVEDARA